MNDIETVNPLSIGQELRNIPLHYGNPGPDKIAYLVKRQKDEQGGWQQVKLAYEGHAEITLDLIQIDPEWSLEILCDETGRWVIDRNEDIHEAVIYGKLTVLGVTRPCIGIAESAKVSRDGKVFPVAELHKQLYSDILRNGAMRFGIGTKLWSKAEGADAASPTQPTTIPEDTAANLTERVKNLPAEQKTLVVTQLEQIGGTKHIAKMPLDCLPAVLSVIFDATIEAQKVRL